MAEITLVDLPDDDGHVVEYTFRFPGTWLEATAKDLMTVAQCRVSGLPEAAVRFDLLRDLGEIPATLMERLPPLEDLLMPVDVTDRTGPFKPVEKFEYRVFPDLDWAFGDPLYRISLLPVIMHAGKEWQGPDDGLDHMSLNQWLYCCSLLSRLVEADEDTPAADRERYLNEFLGALYQPKGQPWGYEEIEAFAAELSTLDPATKLAAVLNFKAINATLPNVYDRLFREGGEVDSSPAGLFSIGYEVASSGVFGPIESTERNLLHKVMGYMEHNLYTRQMAEAKGGGG